MSITIMTPEEFARLPWYARQKAVNRNLRSLRVKSTPGIDRHERNVQWATRVQEEARALLAVLPADPDAAAHRAAL